MTCLVDGKFLGVAETDIDDNIIILKVYCTHYTWTPGTHIIMYIAIVYRAIVDYKDYDDVHAPGVCVD